ncbi:amidase domain-containing protein [Cytobacillus sp. Hz8]|uniref:amidase domain-containing protein n=1 Tax=Cytobacillus sp. Hz8 TaxID=3347168 RepID=UPI0035DD75F7
MKSQLQKLLEIRVQQCVSHIRKTSELCPKIERKKESLVKRKAEIVKAKAVGKILNRDVTKDLTSVYYQVHFQYLIKQKGELYLEEEIENRAANFQQNILLKEWEIDPFEQEEKWETPTSEDDNDRDFFLKKDDELSERLSYQYDRRKAIQYAERWWNSYNPAYKKFENDCTNFISQCLRAGEAPMRGYPNRGTGWWIRGNNWSYSWAIANALRLYLSNSKQGLRAREVSSPEELLQGDVICYDFQGNGRFDHNTIITGMDALGMPLVNAHTTNSRQRYWAYEDSTAYTPNIKYKFFTIVDG